MSVATTSVYATTRGATPVLNTPDFEKAFGELALDQPARLFRAVETVLFPETKCTVVENTKFPHIVQIQTEGYPSPSGCPLYTDNRFLISAEESTPERKKQLPPVSEILRQLNLLQGTHYIWGGAWPEGIPELPLYYPLREPSRLEDPVVAKTQSLEGVDCTGLLHFVSQGVTPHQSFSLTHFGMPVDVKNLSLEKICARMQPLDLISWKGHVVIVFDSKTTIESRASPVGNPPVAGVVKSPLRERLEEILQEKKPLNTYAEGGFVVRRWHPEKLSD